MIVYPPAEYVERAISLIADCELFDEEYYLRQVGTSLGALSPIHHYVVFGWRENLNPSPYFDTKFYIRQYGDLLNVNSCPLVDYLEDWSVHFRKPCSLFDTELYSRLVPADEIIDRDPLSHYLLNGDFLISPHRLFDPSFYLSLNMDVSASNQSPWIHYILYGRFEVRQPHPLFSAKYYVEQLMKIDGNTQIDFFSALAHYAENGWQSNASPHPLFDTHYYRRLFPGLITKAINPLEHFYDLCQQKSASQNEALTAVFHSSNNSAAIHLRDFSSTSAWRFATGMQLQNQLLKLESVGRKIMIFFGHEGSRTGAPLVLVELVRRFAEEYNCVVVLASGGPIVEEYKKYAMVMVFSDDLPKIVQMNDFVDAAKPLIDAEKVVGALINTATLAGLHDKLKANGVRTVTLVHEFLNNFAQRTVEQLYSASDELVFPSTFLKELANKCLPFTEFDLTVNVKPQGLSNPKMVPEI